MVWVEERFDGKVSIATLAIAWCLKNRNVSSVLLGATKISQLKENLKSIMVAKQLTVDDMNAIEAILGNKPKLPQVYRKL